ncbi:MAG: ankyrin repeat domain-containing protein [Acidimicrobiia bacterium]|nr:ankyrin repeat domain-containing protein [Acidimicrobiia bacterium]
MAVAPPNWRAVRRVPGHDLRMQVAELSEAARVGDLGAVRRLLEEGADPALDDDENTALHDALDQGHLAVARELLAAGADPMREHPFFAASALDAAWRGAGAQGVELLAAHGVDPSPLLLVVARNDRPQDLDDLLVIGADVSVADDRGWTPLHFTAAHGYSASVAVLLRVGADAAALTSDGLTPAVLAERNGHVDIALALRA